MEGIDTRPKLKRGHYYEEEEELGWLLLATTQGEVTTPIPLVFEEALGMPALKNPKATIDKVEPLSFRVGDRIDISVYYTPANDEESMWQTMVVVKEGTAVLVQERQKHISMKPGQIRADCDTGKSMPSTPVNLTIEIWGHSDYWTTTWPY